MRTLTRRVLTTILALATLSSAFTSLVPTTSANPGDLIARVTVPVPSGLGVGIAFDGTTFWYTNMGDPTLRGYTVACSPPTCTSTLTHSVPIPVSIGSLAYDASRGVIWGAADSGSGVYRIDPATGAGTLAFTATACASGGLVDGLAYDGSDDTIYYSYDGSAAACKYTVTGTLLDTVPLPPSAGCYNSGVAVGGDILYMGSDGCGRIVAVDKASHADLGVFASPPGSRDESLACDPVTFAPLSVIWSKDAYNSEVTAFEIANGTCGVGGNPPCASAASVALLDPVPGSDYVNDIKTPQSPALALPRVSGPLTIRATTDDVALVSRMDFYVDGVPVGTDTAAPYEASWDSTLATIGTHTVRVRVTDTERCIAHDDQQVLTICGMPLALSVSRPAQGKAYVNDIELPSDPGTPLVVGDVTLQAASSDASRIASVDWSVDGMPLAVAVAAAPWSALWPASQATPGPHAISATFHETDVRCTETAGTTAVVAQLTREAASRALFATTLQPSQPALQSEGASAPAKPSSLFVQQTVPALGAYARVLNDTASYQDANGAHSASELMDVSLLNGLVRARLLHAEADARFDPATLTTSTDASGSHVAGVAVNGVPIVVTQPDTVVAIPGVGRLVLDERIVVAGKTHAELRVNALHLYADANGLRAEVILGQAVAGADVASVPFAGRAHDVDPQSDAGTNGDAGDTYATGLPLAVGLAGDVGSVVVGGRVGGNDLADVYRVRVAEGEKLEVVLKGGDRATFTTHTVPNPPSSPVGSVTLDDLALPDLRLELLEPSDAQPILASDLPLGSPERMELNVNETGVWGIAVTSRQLGNYTLSVSVVPIQLQAANPAGASCGDPASPWLDQPRANTLRGNDTTQWYDVNATIGDDVAVELLMPDADGQDFDVRVFDRTCALAWEMPLGKSLVFDGDSPKGLSEVGAALPALYTGVYHVSVTRFLGDGNYALLPQVASPIPTIPMDDAFTGQDASNDANAPTPLPLPQGVFEGRFEDNDPRDAYSFALGAGEAMVVTMLPSPANSATMFVTGNGANVVVENTGNGSLKVNNRAPNAQTVTVVVAPLVGGGNYALGVVHAGA